MPSAPLSLLRTGWRFLADHGEEGIGELLMVTSEAPSSRPTLGDVALLVGFQVGTSALGIALLEWIGMKGPTSGLALVGTMVGAQAFAGMALRKTPGAFDSRAWTRLALWAALVQLVLGAGVISAAGLPGFGGEGGSPSSTILVVALLIGGPLAFGATLVGLRMGARLFRDNYFCRACRDN